MEVPARLQALTEGMQQDFGAEQLYVVDINEQQTDGVAGTIVFGMRHAVTPALAARFQASQVLQKAINQPVGVEIFTDPLDEVEYLFDRYLRAYIASHDGIVTPVRIDEPAGKLWVHFDGGCSGCPASVATLKHGIERTLKKHLPWIQRVEASNEPVEPDFGIALDFSAGIASLGAEEK